MADPQRIKDLLGKLLTQLQLAFDDITISPEKDFLRVEIISQNPSRIIGWHGETLSALQHLLKSMIRTLEKLETAPFLLLDVDGYRKDQEEKVCRMAEQKAELVRRTGNRIALPPMSPYFRRIVHLHVANSPSMADFSTESIGEGDFRQIVLRLKEEQGGQELTPVMAAADEGLENLDV